MSVSGVTRATVVVLALAVAGVPVARRLCGFACEAAPAPAETAGRTHAHCPAHKAPPAPAKPADPCGQTHSGDGALLTASASLARPGTGLSEFPAAGAISASGPSILAPCLWQTDFDRRPSVPPPATRRPVLRL